MAQLIGGKTLQEIQDLPLSEMHEHMQEHVDPKWQKWSATDGKIKNYYVQVTLTTSGEEEFHVNAHSEEEAEEKANTYIGENYNYDNYEIEHLEVEDD